MTSVGQLTTRPTDYQGLRSDSGYHVHDSYGGSKSRAWKRQTLGCRICSLEFTEGATGVIWKRFIPVSRLAQTSLCGGVRYRKQMLNHAQAV